MCSLISLSTDTCRQTVKLFITIVIILLLGRLIIQVPVMGELQVTDSFNAAEIIWFLAKLSALVVFFLFARALNKTITDRGGFLSFIKGIADPLTVLVIIIMGQALLWELLDPFLRSSGEMIYQSIAIVLIVCASIWLIYKAYQNALFLMDVVNDIKCFLSRVAPQKNTSCEACQATISAKASFCDQCGHQTKVVLNCSECGGKVSEDQLFCQDCGAILNNETGDL